MRNQAKHNIKKYIDERLSEECEKCLVGLNAITKEACNTAHNREDKREKIQALSLAKECYSMKLDLLTNSEVVKDAVNFVVKNKQQNNNNNGNNSTTNATTTAVDNDNGKGTSGTENHGNYSALDSNNGKKELA